MPDQAEDSLDLLQLTQAVYEVQRALKDQALAQQDRGALETWWSRYSRTVGRRLEQTASVAAGLGPKERLSHALGTYILLPDNPRGPRALTDDLPDYVTFMRDQRAREEADIAGQQRPRETGKPTDVLRDQIDTVQNLVRDVRSVRYAVAQTTSLVDHSSPDMHKEADEYRQELRKNVQEPLQALLGDLYDLRDVVDFVDNRLLVAHREDRSELWDAIEKRLAGKKSLQSGENWVPDRLKTHVSLAWVNGAKGWLKSHREGLARCIDEIVWAVEYEDEEAKDKVTRVSGNVPLEKLSGRQWARAFVAEQRRSCRDPLQELSLLEHASDLLYRLRTQAVSRDYPDYTEDADTYLLDLLSRRLDKGRLSRENLEVESYLNERVQALQTLRRQLLPIMGGELLGGEKADSFTVWDSLLRDSVQLMRRGDFAAVDQVLDLHLTVHSQDQADRTTGDQGTVLPPAVASNEPDTLPSVVQLLTEIRKPGQAEKGAMERRLLAQTDKHQERLEAEEHYVQRLGKRAAELRMKFEGHVTTYNGYLGQWRQLAGSWRSKLPWLFRRHRTRKELCMGRLLAEFCSALRLCPQDGWVQDKARKVPSDRPGDCTELDRDTWLERYLPDILQPSQE